MSGISGILGGILDFLTGNLSQLTGNIVALGLTVFALGLGFFAIRYLGRRRQMLHTERMAAMVKGLHYAGVARDVFAKPQTDSRDHLLCGLRWMFGAAGLSGALYGYEQLQAVPDPLNAMRPACRDHPRAHRAGPPALLVAVLAAVVHRGDQYRLLPRPHGRTPLLSI